MFLSFDIISVLKVYDSMSNMFIKKNNKEFVQN